MSSVELGWRKFNFFDKIAVADPADESKKYAAFKASRVVCTATARRRAICRALGARVLLLGDWRRFYAARRAERRHNQSAPRPAGE